MSKITLDDLANLQNENTAIATINDNSATIETAFDNTLSRDGTSPNQMGANLDMNSHKILNLPTPTSNFEPLRVIDKTTLNGGGSIVVSNLPAGGNTKFALTKNSGADFDVSWQAPVPVGGAANAALMKNSTSDFDLKWQYPIPNGGLSHAVLTKNSNSDFDTNWQYPVPVGGSTNSVLTKNSAADFDFSWSTASASKSYTSVTGQTRTASSTDSGKIIIRSNSGANMQDAMPISGVAGTYTYTNGDTAGILAITASGGATIDGSAANYILLGPGQVAVLNMDVSGSNYRTVSAPARAKVAPTTTVTIYVQATGSDANPGVLSSSPKSTRQAIYDEVYQRYDIGAARMVVQHTGNFTDNTAVLRGRPPGLGNDGAATPYAHTLHFLGDTTTPSNCTITSTNNCFSATNNTSFHVDGFRFISTNGHALSASFGSVLGVGSVNFGACPNGNHFDATFGGGFHFDNNYTISGNAQAHKAAASGGYIQNQGGSLTCTLTGTPAFANAFMSVQSNGLIVDQTTTYTGAATGTRFAVGPYGGAFNLAYGTDPNTLLPGSVNGTYTGVFNNANGVVMPGNFTTGNFSALTASQAVQTDGGKSLVTIANTGTGNNVLSAAPQLTGSVNIASLGAAAFVTTDASKNLSSFATANNGVLVTNGSGVPSIGTTLPNIALGTPTSVTLTNGTGLPTTGLTGVLQAAQEPAHTGDMTNTSGSLATTVTGINGVNQNAAWTSFSPTITAQTGTITTSSATGRYRQIGKTIICQVDVTITIAGTGAGGLRASLPFTAAAFNYVGSCRDIILSGKSGACAIAASGTTLDMRDATGATMIANTAEIIGTITYEIP